MVGRMMWNGTDALTINTKFLAAGIYILKDENGNCAKVLIP
jgi:hypothetical protein